MPDVHDCGTGRKPKVYIAGPYTKGDVAANVARAILAADTLISLDFVPYTPHLSHFMHMMHPRSYDFWLDYDAEWLRMCDALFRLSGESEGSDKEVKLAQSMNMPVFYEQQLDDMILHFRHGGRVR